MNNYFVKILREELPDIAINDQDHETMIIKNGMSLLNSLRLRQQIYLGRSFDVALVNAIVRLIKEHDGHQLRLQEEPLQSTSAFVDLRELIEKKEDNKQIQDQTELILRIWRRELQGHISKDDNVLICVGDSAEDLRVTFGPQTTQFTARYSYDKIEDEYTEEKAMIHKEIAQQALRPLTMQLSSNRVFQYVYIHLAITISTNANVTCTYAYTLKDKPDNNIIVSKDNNQSDYCNKATQELNTKSDDSTEYEEEEEEEEYEEEYEEEEEESNSQRQGLLSKKTVSIGFEKI